MYIWSWVACGGATVSGAPSAEGLAPPTQAEPAAEVAPSPAVGPPEGGDPAVRAAWVKLAAALDAPAGAELAYETRDLAEVGLVVRVQHVHAYPGTGVVSVVLREGRTYGRHGEAPLADLVRALGWVDTPPALPLLVRVVDAALFEGMASLSEGSLERDPTWRLTATRFGFPGDDERVVVEVGPSGPERVTRSNLPRR
jgi:hypothetical protein